MLISDKECTPIHRSHASNALPRHQQSSGMSLKPKIETEIAQFHMCPLKCTPRDHPFNAHTQECTFILGSGVKSLFFIELIPKFLIRMKLHTGPLSLLISSLTK